jgi:hypothetical protein
LDKANAAFDRPPGDQNLPGLHAGAVQFWFFG